MKAATYCRVSTDEQAQNGTSLVSQRERTRAYIDEHAWTLVDEFVDEGVSGARESRPALDRLIKACGDGEVEVIVTPMLDRFTRDERLWHNWKHLLTGLGVRIVTCDGTVDTADEESWFTDSVLAAVASKYRRDFAKRTTQGRRAKAKEGVWVGGKPPFGFAIEDRRLVVNEDEAATLRRACSLVLQTKTLHDACEVLNEEGRLPRQVNPRRMKPGPVLWNPFKLRYALTRETLIGKYVYGKTSDVQVEVACPRILTDAEWDRVQAVLIATSKQIYNRPKVFPLSSRLVSPCGLTYSGTYDATMDRRFYRCKGREHAPYCSCRRIDAQTVEDQVFAEVLSFLDDPKRLLEVTGLDKEETDESRREQVRTLDARIARLSEAITDKAADALAAGLSPTLIASAVAKLERERNDLIERRERMVEREASRREREGRRRRISLLARASWSLVNSTDEQRKTIFALLDVRATVTDHGLEIAGILREDLPEILDVETATTS